MPRPFSVTVLCAALAGLALYNGLGAAAAWDQRSFWAGLPLTVAPGYLLARPALWAVAFTGLAAGLWRQWPGARLAVAAAWPVYLAWGWVELLAWSPAGASALNWGWLLGADVLSLAGVAYALSRRPPQPAA
ncbi:MAG: hypothetical protein JNK29_01245 [Anaerolineales bacterium]|nr:hypothetical protein [Anaerolineales bacterium]